LLKKQDAINCKLQAKKTLRQYYSKATNRKRIQSHILAAAQQQHKLRAQCANLLKQIAPLAVGERGQQKRHTNNDSQGDAESNGRENGCHTHAD